MMDGGVGALGSLVTSCSETRDRQIEGRMRMDLLTCIQCIAAVEWW